MWRSNIGNRPAKGLDRKHVSVCSTEQKGFISCSKRVRRYVHSTSEKRVRVLSKLNGRSNPRNKVRDHWWPPGEPVFLVYHPGNSEEQDSGNNHLGLFP